ncbi:MAG: hypothetical protein ACI8QZ_002192, partial [Chlamydiales bacterium]
MNSKRGLRGHLVDLAIGLVLTAILLGMGEASLRALGMADPGAQADLSRGFDATAAYIVPDPEVTGGWVTQFAEGGLKEVT